VSEAVYGERMSASDTLLWNNERDPMLRSTIISMMVLEGAPDPARFAGAVARSLGRVPRLRQRVVLDPLRAAPPRWEQDPHFDLEYHVRRVRLPGEGTLRDLHDLAEPIAMQAFDKDRPLWELHVVEGLDGGRHALLMKLHHAISDGVGLVRMTSSLVERSPDPDPRHAHTPSLGEELEATPTAGPFEDALQALRYRAEANWRGTRTVAGALGRGLAGLLTKPRETIRSVGDAAGSVGRLLRPISEPLSPVLRGRSLAVHFDALSVPVADLKRSGKVAGGTLNDAFVAAICGGMRRYHERHGHPVGELRMTMPINLRAPGEEGKRAGNQFVPARFPVPIAIVDPVERMLAIRRCVLKALREPALPFSENISSVIERLPRRVAVPLVGSMLKAIDFVTSNVPGPSFAVYASGARVERMVGFGPLSGAAVNVTAFSYDGTLQLGVNMDAAAVPDPDVLLACLQDGLAEVLAAA
jgi:WS/DGAT/MGAT family acyltransferase